MLAKIKLKSGEPIGGKNKNLIYIKDMDGNFSARRVLVYDKDYDEYFDGNLGTLRHYESYHSHATARKLANLHNRKWHCGEIKTIMGQDILFVDEYAPKVYQNGEVFRIGSFKNLNTNIVFKTTVSAVLSGNSLGVKMSKGELKIQNILNNLNIKYIREHSFSNFVNNRNKKNFPFDFYLPDYNCCIEYDGEQHYKGWKREEESLLIIQDRDKRKNKFCKENDIKLLRIPYFDFDKIDLNYLVSKLNDIGVHLVGKEGNLVVVPNGSTPMINTGK